MNQKEELIEYIQNNQNCFSRYLSKTKPHLHELVKDFYGKTTAEKCYNYLNDDNWLNFTNCKICKRETNKFITIKRGGYRIYCSNKCSTNDPEKKDVMLKGLKTEESKKKRKCSLIQKYGSDSLISINRQKAIKSTQEKYGVDYAFQSKVVRDTRDRNVKKKYGVDNVFQIESIKLQTKESLLKRGLIGPSSLKPEEIEKRLKLQLLEEQKREELCQQLIKNTDELIEFINETHYKSEFKRVLQSKYKSLYEHIMSLDGDSFREKVWRLTTGELPPICRVCKTNKTNFFGNGYGLICSKTYPFKDVEKYKTCFENGIMMKTYILNSGKEIQIMGYEGFVIDHLIESGIDESLIDLHPPCIEYKFEEKTKIYIPDFWIPSLNLIYEVKSIYIQI